MTAYLIRRVGQAIAVVIGLMILTFILIHMVPGSAARAALGVRATPGRIAIFNATYGLDKPLYQQFISYADQVLHGNLGTSYTQDQPVLTLIAQRLPKDLILLWISTVLAVAIALPLGIYQAVKLNSLGDNLATSAAFILYSMPSFFLGIILIQIFAISFPILNFEASQSTSIWTVIGDWHDMLLPILTLTLISVAAFSRYMRSSSIDVLAQDYIKVARAKGLSERLVLTRHVLRNSLLPVVTILGLALPDIVAGAVIVESIFNFPGMGLLFWQSALAHDFPVMLGGTLIIGVATVAGNLAADVAYSMLDPRIRYGRA